MSRERLGKLFSLWFTMASVIEMTERQDDACVRIKSIVLDLHILPLYSWVYKRSSGRHREQSINGTRQRRAKNSTRDEASGYGQGILGPAECLEYTRCLTF
jgi:hypothetical protein